MRFRIPAPLHGWRQFAGEVGVVVLGVLLALGAQQLVDAANWRGDVDDARGALDRELAYNLGAFQRRVAMNDCFERRLDELTRWEKAWRAGAPIRLLRPIGWPQRRTIHTGVWEVTQTGQVASHFPLDVKVRYAEVYDVLTVFQTYYDWENEAWAELQGYDETTAPSPAELTRLRVLIARLRRLDRVTMLNRVYLAPRVAQVLRIAPEKLPLWSAPGDASFCTPLI